jgi:hypothetical protein
MQEPELNSATAVTQNVATFAVASLSIIALAMMGAMFFWFPYCLLIVSVLSCGVGPMLLEGGMRRQISLLSSAMLASFSVIGISIEKEGFLGVIAEPLAFGSIGVLLISVSLIVYRVLSPIWNKPSG